MQQPHRPFRRRLLLLVTRADHQCAEVQIVAFPLLIDWHFNINALGRHIQFLPPQRTIAGFHQQVALAGGRRFDMQLHFLARLVGRFVEFQLHLVRTYSPTTISVVLPAVTGPETQAADQIALRIHDLNTICAPLHRETDLGAAVGGDIDRLFRQWQILLIVQRLPAFAF
ncbi:hypothetical protein D3C73_1244560 [compost metagenome]